MARKMLSLVTALLMAATALGIGLRDGGITSLVLIYGTLMIFHVWSAFGNWDD